MADDGNEREREKGGCAYVDGFNEVARSGAHIARLLLFLGSMYAVVSVGLEFP